MGKTFDLKAIAVIAGIIVALILFVVVSFVTTNNHAIGLEEQIFESSASVKVQEKRRVDLVYNLADTVQEYAKHEKEVFTELAAARSQADGGDVEQASMAIKAVAEAYPELKADKVYSQLMTDLTLTENLIAQYRENYNFQIKQYNKYVRKFPNGFILGGNGL